MAALSPEQKARIFHVLDELGATQPCFRCRHTDFGLLDGYFNPILEREPGHVTGTGGVLSVPSVVLICGRCGSLSHHALTALVPEEHRS